MAAGGSRNGLWDLFMGKPKEYWRFVQLSQTIFFYSSIPSIIKVDDEETGRKGCREGKEDGAELGQAQHMLS